MEELDYPGYMGEEHLYVCVQDVLNGRGYSDEGGEVLYNSDEVEVALNEDVLEISAASSSEEQQIARLVENRLDFS
jgi:hypothetical protein